MTEPVLVRLGILSRTRIRLPTWRVWLCLALGLAVLAFAGVRSIYPFLSPTEPVTSEILVVEGWLPDYFIASAVQEFKRGHYKYLVTTGGPLLNGAPLADYKTEAELTAALFEKLGFSSNVVIPLPAASVSRDRTYASALAVRQWFEKQPLSLRSLNVLTRNTHARRTWLLFQQAFGRDAKIGIIASPDDRYDSTKWWTTSEGVRDVVDETIAYVYARFLFTPRKH